MRRVGLLLLALATAPCAGQQQPGFADLVNTGQLDQAAAWARRAGDRLGLGQVMVLQGRLDSASALFTAVRAERGTGYRSALSALATLAARRGDRAEVAALATEMLANPLGPDASSADRVAWGDMLALTADGDPEQVRSALAAYDAATRNDSADVAGRLAAAALFLNHYNAPEARADYQRVLDREPDNTVALVGMARVAAFSGDGDAVTWARRALAINPRSVDAWLVLARRQFESELYDSAAASLAHARDLDSSRVDVWALAGALAWVGDDSVAFATATAAALQRNPRGGDYFGAIAEAAARQRRYQAAVDLAARGVAGDSSSVAAWVAWGTNLLRTQQIAAGRRALEQAFARDPFHLWTKNSLDLLDQLETFAVVRSARFEIVAPRSAADLLGQMLLPLLETGYDSLAARYDYLPPTPIRVELYDRHADFSVRTIGLAGFGALGVSFGTTLVIDAPEARRPGSFNIGSVVWHELGHTFTLGRSGHRVPRWLSEGLSVLEERRARPGWGAAVTPNFVAALAAGELLPLSALNDGFLRADRPDRLALSYYHASLVAEYLEATVGMSGIQHLLDGYARGATTDSLIAEVTGRPIARFDQDFTAWLRGRLPRALAAIAAGDSGVIAAPFGAGIAALAAGDSTAAQRLFERARDDFPAFGGEAGPRMPLAQLYFAAGDTAAALAELAVVTRHDETALAANQLEAQWRLVAADTLGAVQALERASWIAPTVVELWQRMAVLATAAGRFDQTVRARRALMALDPADPLAAQTDLAEALLADGQLAAARRELLSVLERAPTYSRALTALMDVRARSDQ